ncbi:MAG: prepilin-type N-terminal cleavage/methylation domain-containing protein [Planctomycetota bacterium]
MNPRKPTTRGFTLIEIVVVLFLVALLASAVAIAAGGVLNNATRDEAVAQIGSMDREARRAATRLGRPVELRIDREARRFTLYDPAKPNAAPLGGLAASSRFELTQAWRISRGKPVHENELVVRYGPDGTAATWGFTLSERNTQDGLTSVVVLGMTGQTTQWEDHEQAQDMLAAALGRHAD